MLENRVSDASLEYITFVLPCLNESKTLSNCISRIHEVIHRIKKTASIIVVDNGSTDNSREIAREFNVLVIDEPIKGYGSAIISGCSRAQGRYIVIGDADGSYDFAESIPMINELEKGNDLVVGSRYKGKILAHSMPFLNRYFGNPILTGILNLFFKSHVTDANSGLRAISNSAYRKLNLQCSGMEFASEMIIKASILGLKIKEVPIILSPDGRKRKSHLRPWRDGWRHLKLLMLYSPKWLYFIPGSFMFFVGFILNLSLNIIPENQYIYIKSLFLGTHWTVPATLLAVLGLQMDWLGLFSVSHSINNKLYPAPNWFTWVKKAFNFEWCIIIGSFCVIVGFLIEMYIFIKWLSLHFGELDEVRLGIYGMMWINIGIVIISNGFFLDIINTEKQEM